MFEAIIFVSKILLMIALDGGKRRSLILLEIERCGDRLSLKSIEFE